MFNTQGHRASWQAQPASRYTPRRPAARARIVG